MDTLAKYLAVAGGSALGGMARYYLGTSGLTKIGGAFPFATFVINVSGSFILGFFLTLATEYLPIPSNLRLAVAVGFVGAFTTFSTFEFEIAKLIEARGHLLAALYVTLSVLVGFLAVTGGMWLARNLGLSPLAGRPETIRSLPSSSHLDEPKI